MEPQNMHQELQQVSSQIKEAQASVFQAQGSDARMLEQAELIIQEARQNLQMISKQNGTEATGNAQFQQAYEELHDIRQQIQEAQQNNNDVL